MKAKTWVIFSLFFLGCHAANSKPCSQDNECEAAQRCRRGACGPICLDDSECGDSQVCRSGACTVRPECRVATDCATGFKCVSDRCQCSTDASCGSNQQCTNGTCTTRARCTADADCVGQGGRCEVTQGLCLPSCTSAIECAPQLDPRVALGLYACLDNACVRRCVTDVTCGGSGFVCSSGLCKLADCATLADCPAGQYCTSAAFGRCTAYSTCSDGSSCQRNWECRTFNPLTCPPGFNCEQKLCLELPQCLADSDCVTVSLPNQPASRQTGYCSEGHCQPTVSCDGPGQCGAGLTCIARVCVPKVCRGHSECSPGLCIDGACVNEPAAGDINSLRMTPSHSLVAAGASLQLHLIAYRLDGSSFPLAQGEFEVVDSTGAPSALATVSATGAVQALNGGAVVIRAKATGSALAAVESTVTITPRTTSGFSVTVIDPATQTLIQNAAISYCDSAACSNPVEIITDGGRAEFSSSARALNVTAVARDVRADGLPVYERVSILGIDSHDIVVPLRANTVHGAAGFNASLSFSKVSTNGTYWAGLVAASFDDLPSVKPTDLLGDTFNVRVDLINQAIPVPGAVVLYTSPAFGFPQEVKPRSLGFGQPGERFAVGYAGRGELAQVLSARSVDFLGYLSAFDYALDPTVTLSSKPYVADTADVNGNGLCSTPSRCPMGTEDVPDYAHFARVSMTPQRQQNLRTEVVLPSVPQAITTVLIAGVQIDSRAGMLPVGFASRAPGAVASDGTRPVASVTLRSGSPYNGVEISEPGVWALGTNAAGTGLSARLMRFAGGLPEKLSVAPLLPLPVNGSYQPSTRTFAPGQPTWSSVYSSGAEVARVTLTGTEQRHAVYFAINGAQTSVIVPASPAGPGIDPASQANASLEVVAIDLSNGIRFGTLFDMSGPRWSAWVMFIDGYSRFDR